MKQLSASWKKLKNYLYKNYGQESGKMIVHTGVVTWILASAAQVGAIVFNDKIPSDQKKFLIPQEIADGVINIIAFYAVTNTMKNLAGRLVSTGKWSNAPIRKFVKEHPLKEVKLGELSTNLAKSYKGNEDFYKAYSPFKNGVDMIATTIGSIVSCNVIAPFIRNPLGAFEQKRSIEKENSKNVKHQLNKSEKPLAFKSNYAVYNQNRLKI